MRRRGAFAWTTEILDSTAASVMKIGADWSILFANRDVRRRIPHLQVGDTFWDVFPEGGVATLAALSAGFDGRARRDHV